MPRLSALFAAHMKDPTSAYVVGDQIRRIIESDSWRLRYPVGFPGISELHYSKMRSCGRYAGLEGAFNEPIRHRPAAPAR